MELVNVLLKQVYIEARQVGIPVSANISPNVIINTRAKTRFGCCKQVGDRFEIELSERVVAAGETACLKTLAHEILHTCPGCRNHGKLWKAYAALMKKSYGYTITRLSSPESLGVEPKVPEAKYAVVCTKCGRRFERMKASKLIKRPYLYRCTCGGKLKRVGGAKADEGKSAPRRTAE